MERSIIYVKGTAHNYDGASRVVDDVTRAQPVVPTRSYQETLGIMHLPLGRGMYGGFNFASQCRFMDAVHGVCTVLGEKVDTRKTCMRRHRACFHYRSCIAQKKRMAEIQT